MHPRCLTICGYISRIKIVVEYGRNCETGLAAVLLIMVANVIAHGRGIWTTTASSFSIDYYLFTIAQLHSLCRKDSQTISASSSQ